MSTERETDSIPLRFWSINAQKLMAYVVFVFTVAERAKVTAMAVPAAPKHPIDVALPALTAHGAMMTNACNST